MTIEATASSPVKRTVNIESAIDQSSFQMPVFVAISTQNGEAQVAKTFATARDVFDHIFSILLDRILQRRAVDAVEALVPASAELKSSRDTEYVLLVRGKAIFWFSGAAAKRSAGRRLLLEHARELAEAEQKPFYILNSRKRKIRAAKIALGVLIIVPLASIVGPLAIERTKHAMLQRASPAASTIESRDPTVDRDASIGNAAGDPASHRSDPAPAAATGPSPARPSRNAAATTQERPRRSPDGPGPPAIIADRFWFWNERLRLLDPFADPLPAVDSDPTIAAPAATIAERDIVAAVPAIAGDPVAIRQLGNDRDRPK